MVGVVLFVRPGALAAWPWALSALTSRAIGAWLISFGIAAGAALVEGDLGRLRAPAIAYLVFAVAELLAVLRYRSTLAWDTAPAWLYLAFLVLAGSPPPPASRPPCPGRHRPAADRREARMTEESVRPAIVVVSRSAAVREQLCGELQARYARDYERQAFEDPEAAPAGRRDSPVALVLGGLRRGGPRRPRRPRPAGGAAGRGALRVPIVRWGDWRTTAPIFEALALGQVDRWTYRPETTPDEYFHEAVTEFLREWRARQGGGFEAVRIIGEQWSPRSQQLRDLFTRNRIPLGFYDADRPRRAGAAGPARSRGAAAARRPAAVRREQPRPGEPVGPRHRPGLRAHAADRRRRGVRRRRRRRRARPGWAPPCTRRPRDCGRSSSSREAVGGQAGTSSLIRNYLGFPTGISGSQLTFGAFQQAWVFGARFHFMRARRPR